MKTLQALNQRALQPSNKPTMSESEQFEALDSLIIENSQSSASFSSKKKGQACTSPIWNHTTTSHYNVVHNIHGKSVQRCKYCQKEYSEASGTTIIITHLKEHKIDIIFTGIAQQATIQSNIADAFQRAKESSAYKRHQLALLEKQCLDPAVLEYLYVQQITLCGVAFRMVDQSEFRV